MNRRCARLVAVLGCLFSFIQFECLASEEKVDSPTATIAGPEGKSFPTIQQALDAASPGDTIQLSPGRFNERITISQPVTLVGDGAGKTILGPTEQQQIERWDHVMLLSGEIDTMMRAAESAKPRRELTEPETAAVKKNYAEIERLVNSCLQPVIQIEKTELVELRNLGVTMPLTPHEGIGLQVTAAATVNDAQARLAGCAVVGCLSTGVRSEGVSHLEIADSLVAACWGTGVVGAGADAEVRIVNSDIRNNYHYNIKLSSDACVIEGCRISGTAWSGVSCGGRIERNVIFGNSRGIYSAGPKGVVRHNLIYRNRAGASCWSSDQPVYESNVFLENSIGAISVSGPAEPKIRNNLFVGSPDGMSYGSMKITGGEKPPATEFHIKNNVFWQVEQPARLRKSREDHSLDEPLTVVGDDGNRLADPQVEINDEQLVIGNHALASELKIEQLLGLSLRSSWPITTEELAMIPDDGTVDSSKWKKRPKLRAKY